MKAKVRDYAGVRRSEGRDDPHRAHGEHTVGELDVLLDALSEVLAS
jgi:hypothetical protein